MIKVIVTSCPVCGELIEVVSGYKARETECPECNELFRIFSLEPLQLAYAHDLDVEGDFYDE